MSAESQLPSEILALATLRGDEYAWPIDAIPTVIEEAKKIGLVSVGGQLQFRMHEGICECYWVEVDTCKFVPDNLSWSERVVKAADVALTRFNRLQEEVDFVAEGRREFANHITQYEKRGGTAQDAMCFVWYLEAEPE